MNRNQAIDDDMGLNIPKQLNERRCDMNLFKTFWDAMNGKKLNTATVMIIVVFVLGQFGLEKEAATQMVSQIMTGIAGVLALVGFIHRLIKSAQEKNELLKTAGESIAKTKMLPIILLASAICFSANAGILSNLISPAPETKKDSVRIVLQMDIPVGIIGLTKSREANKQLDAKILNCVGFGPSLQWQQWTGLNYTNFAITAAVLFFPKLDSDPFPWDVGAGLFVTAFGGYGFGAGYNAGTVEGKTINRFIGMIIADVIPWRNK
jgi:hypothetical protein